MSAPLDSPADRSNRNMLVLGYVLYGLSALGLFVSAIPFAGFISLTAIVAVILNHAKSAGMAGSWLSTHNRWQMRTFWFGLLWTAIGWALIFTVLGAVIGLPLLFVVAIWMAYRVVRGWLRLSNDRPMYAA